MFDLAKYSYANAKIRGMLSHLISPEHFNRLLEASDPYSLLEQLKNTPYQVILEKSSDASLNLEVVEQELLRQAIIEYQKVLAVVSAKNEREFIFLVIQRQELNELKVALRYWHKKSGVEPQDFLLADKICYNINFLQLLMASNIEEIILLLQKTPYKKPLFEARQKYKEHNSVFYLEAALEVDYYQRLGLSLEKLSSYDSKAANKILSIEVDIENINWFIRMRKYYSFSAVDTFEWFIPGGGQVKKETVRELYAADSKGKEIDSAALGRYGAIKELLNSGYDVLENFLYQILFRETKKILSGFPFTIGVIYAYFILKRKEIRNLISLIYAKELNWDKEKIEPMLL